jgi:hypothetical protein
MAQFTRSGHLQIKCPDGRSTRLNLTLDIASFNTRIPLLFLRFLFPRVGVNLWR